MADSEAKQILGNLWAENGDREEPEDLGLTRTTGWPVAYEQIGAGKEPERTLFNQLLRELTGWASDGYREGVRLWDGDANYAQHAFVQTAEGLYVANRASGPALGNAVNPLTETPQSESQRIWRKY